MKSLFKLFLVAAFLFLQQGTIFAKQDYINVSDVNSNQKLMSDSESGVEFDNLSRRDKIISKSQRKIDVIYPDDKVNKLGISFPGNRGPNQLVIYKREYGRRTNTNEFGKEAVVMGNMVVQLTGADTIIPHGGLVISGHGSAKKWITDNLQIGTKIKIDEANHQIFAYTTLDSYRYGAKVKIDEVEKIIENSKKINRYQDDRKAREWLKKAKKELRHSNTFNQSEALECLKRSSQFSKVALSYTLPYLQNELKGVWVRPTEKNENEVERTLDAISALGVNSIFLETYFHGKTIFPSDVMKGYGFSPQNPTYGGYDALSAWIKGAHKRNIKVHVWFESFYIGNKVPSSDPNNILTVKPAWGNVNKVNFEATAPVAHNAEHRGYFLDPANPEVIEFLTKLILEISAKYDIDGFNLDYVRYPLSAKSKSINYDSSNWGYTLYAREDFKKLYDIDPVTITPESMYWDKWCQYRQDRITKFIASISKILKDRGILLSAVVFPDYKMAMETKQQNWAKWSNYGYIDAITPLILTSDYQLADDMIDELKKKTSSKTEIFPGLFVGFMEGESEDLLRQIHIIRNQKLNGLILFDWAHMDKKYSDVLSTCAFRTTCIDEVKK